ncbi:2-keto-4-pentenoate hydratase [Nonomuraea jabiensis]|uniref:2-keto-4-pentenoate hydratase n=1 Tax=Nonomuraea jabiensis TaxID=882448 RepID=UPI003D76615D
MKAVRAAAERLIQADASHTPCEPVRDLIGEVDQIAAYRVQELVTQTRLDSGRRIVGRKIGLTSRAVQAQLGVASPDYGALLDDMAYADREPIPLGRFLQPQVEAEVAFVLDDDLDVEMANVADVIRATAFVLPAIEVVDSRIADWDIRVTDTIADNASGGAFVLGTTPRALSEVDLPAIGMAIETADQVVSSGAGVACLGSPVAAVVWLARTLAGQGVPLLAGDVILSGALGPMVPVTAPGSFCARLSGLGQVSAVFTQGEDA